MNRRIIYLVFCISLILSNLFIFSACNKEKNSEFCKIQSISYIMDNEEITLYSKIYFNYNVDECSEEEYNNATNKGQQYYTNGIIQVDGTIKNQGTYVFNNGDNVDDLQKYIGESHYICNDYHFPYMYSKITYTDLIVSYLNIKFIDSNTFQLKYYNQNEGDFVTIQIKTTNYKITYFN